MSGYTLLIADDEPIELEALAFFLRASFPQLRVLSAENGIDLLNKAEAYRPDIIVTDVEMPGLNGLETLRLLRSRGLRTRSVIHTAYSHFQYAREAIEVAADAYVLKPAKREDLKALVARFLDELRSEQAARERQEAIGKALEEARPLVEQDFLTAVLLGEGDEVSLRNYLDILGLDAQGGRIIAFYRAETDPASLGAPVHLRTVVRRVLPDFVHPLVGPMVNGKVPVFVPSPTSDALRDMMDLCRLASKEALQQTGSALYAGIGRPAALLAELRSSYLEALAALESTRADAPVSAAEAGSSVFWGDALTLEEPTLREFLDRGDLRSALSRCSGALERAFKAGRPLESLKDDVLALVLSLYRDSSGFYASCGEPHAALSDLRVSVSGLSAAAAFEDLAAWVRNALGRYAERAGAAIRRCSDPSVDRALAYIDAHYMDNISLDMVASSIGVSPCHLSHLFSKSLGKNYISYLTEYRVKAALRILERRRPPLDELAAAVGYGNPSYFAKVFLRITGRSVKAYYT